MRSTPIGFGSVLALVVAFHGPAVEAVAPCPLQRVSRDELVRGMRMHGEYDILATTNRGRFSSELLLLLARWARDRDPGGAPLYIDAEDWFFAYLDVAGVGIEDAPQSALLGLEHGQRISIEYRPDRVIDEVIEGPDPLLAVNVRAWWPEGPRAASKFTFTDTTATPQLKITSHREITYRLLEFEDMIVVDRIEGITGRPLTGLLGTLFDIIGEGGLKHSRLANAADESHVVRARSKKIFSVSATVTVEPDGTASRGVPPDRPDLAELEERLKRSLKIEYVPYSWDPAGDTCAETDSGPPRG